MDGQDKLGSNIFVLIFLFVGRLFNLKKKIIYQPCQDLVNHKNINLILFFYNFKQIETFV